MLSADVPGRIMRIVNLKVSTLIISILILLSLMITPINYTHGSQSSENRSQPQDTFDHSYSSYNTLLDKYVKDARVDYGGFLANKDEFESFLDSLGEVKQSEYGEWTYREKLAFWINAYNAFTIKAIIDHYPITRSFSLIGLFVPSNSILQIKGVWDRLEFKAVGRMVTLEEIEHEILRKEFNEPRIHTAINCASISCPDLRGEAYMPDRLYVQLTDASINFVNNPVKGFYVSPEKRRVEYSKIFKWFGEDFIESYGDAYTFEGRDEKENAVLNFALVYLKSDDSKKYLRNNKFNIGHLDYDWHLNEETDEE